LLLIVDAASSTYERKFRRKTKMAETSARYSVERRRALLDRREPEANAIDYAMARAKFGREEIRVLNPNGTVESILPFGEGGNKL
jgi:hypothetical protein